MGLRAAGGSFSTCWKQAGLGGRPYTLGNSIHLGGEFSMSPIGAGAEPFATLAHEAAHVVDFTESFGNTLAGAISDQTKYAMGVEGRAGGRSAELAELTNSH